MDIRVVQEFARLADVTITVGKCGKDNFYTVVIQRNGKHIISFMTKVHELLDLKDKLTDLIGDRFNYSQVEGCPMSDPDDVEAEDERITDERNWEDMVD